MRLEQRSERARFIFHKATLDWSLKTGIWVHIPSSNSDYALTASRVTLARSSPFEPVSLFVKWR